MDRTVSIILRFIDDASAQASAAAKSITQSFGNINSQASKDASATSSNVQGFFGKMVDGVKGVLTDLTEHAKWASLMIGGALTAAFADVINTASEFEKLNVATKFLTGSAESAQRFYGEIENIARITPFTIAQIAELGKRVVGNTKDVDQSSRVLMVMSDAVTATGGNYGQLEGAVRAWIQTNSKARASSEELNRQFANANIPVIRILAEAISKDLDHPLRKYIETAGAATGVSATLTKAFQSSSDKLPELNKGIEATNKKLSELKDAGKEGSSAYLSAQKTLLGYQRQLGDANEKIGEYSSAQKAATVVTKAATLSVEDVLAQLQNLGDLDIPGTIMAEEVLKALENAYGGASQTMLNSFSGQLSMAGDNLTRVKVAIMGVSAAGTDQNGILGKLTKILWSINDVIDSNIGPIKDFATAIGGSNVFLLAMAGILGGAFYGFLTGIIAPITTAALSFAGFGAAIGLVGEALIKNGDAVGEASNQYSVLNEYIDHQKATAGGLGKDVQDLLVPAYKDLGGKLYDANIQYDDMSQFVGTVMAKKKDLKVTVEDLNKQLSPQAIMLRDINKQFDLLAKSLSPVFNLFNGMSGGLIEVNDGLSLLGFVIKIPIVLLTALFTILSLVALKFRETAEGVGAFYDRLTGNNEGVAQHIENIRGLQNETLKLGDNYAAAWDNMNNVSQEKSVMVNGVLVNVQGTIQNLEGQVRSSGVNMSTDFGTSMQGIAFSSQTYGLQASDYIRSNFGLMSTEVANKTQNMSTTVETKMTGIANTVQSKTIQMKNDSIFNTSLLEKESSNNFLKLYDSVNNYTSGAAGRTSTNFKSMSSTATTESNNLMSNYKNALDSGKPKVDSSMSAIMSSVNSQMSSSASGATGKGSSLITNFVEGIKSGLRGLGSLAHTIAEKMGLGDLKFQHGGIVPGPIGSAVPIIAHAGERIVPRSGVDGGGGSGGMTFNFYGGVVVDSEERINELANKISDVLGRQNELARYGVGI